jgi:hypothetical protein
MLASFPYLQFFKSDGLSSFDKFSTENAHFMRAIRSFFILTIDGAASDVGKNVTISACFVHMN